MTADGTEFLVNTNTDNVQDAPQLVALSDGGFVAVWQSNDGADDTSDFGIKAQVFDEDGLPTGPEIAVNSLTKSKQLLPSVDALVGGGFVVTWQSNDQTDDSSSYGIKAQVFNAGGTPSGGEFLVNTITGGSQTEPHVLGLETGGFIISWKGDDSNGTGVKAQLFDAGGDVIGTEFTVNTEQHASQEDVAMTALSGGGFVATWSSRDRVDDSSSWGVKAQIFDEDAQPVGDEFLVNTTTRSSQQDASITTLANGDFVITWRSSDGIIDSSGTGIRAQIFTADGIKRGEELQVNSEFDSTQSDATVAALSGGGFVVTWRSLDGTQDTEGSGIKAQIFDADGAPQGGEFLLNETIDGSQTAPVIAGLPGDRFVAMWESADEDNGGIIGRVFASNTPPEAENDSFALDEDGMITGNVTTNDGDADGQTLTAAVVTDVENGTLELAADGSFTYTPDANFHGQDQFIYAVDDGSGVTASAVVTLTVNAVNDGPVANDDTLRVNEDTSATGRVLTNDDDVDGDSLTVSVLTDVSHGTIAMQGTGRYTYTPDAGFFGTDSFTYQIDDGMGGTDSATVTITVNEVNFGPDANHDYFDAAQNETISGNVLDNDMDPDDDALSVSIVHDVRNGTLDLTADGSFVYTPDAAFSGEERFTYELSDGKGGTDRATVRITVDPDNFAPVAEHDYVLMDMGQTYGGNVLDNDTDPDGDALSVVLVNDVLSGSLVLTADGAFSYVAADGFVGSDRFTYQVDDGRGGTDTATVRITVDGVIPETPNTPPTGGGDDAEDDSNDTPTTGGSDTGDQEPDTTGETPADPAPETPTDDQDPNTEDETGGGSDGETGGDTPPEPIEDPEEEVIEEPAPEPILIQQTELIINGDFEDNPLQKGRWQAFRGDAETGLVDEVPGWFLERGHLELQNGVKGGTARGPDMQDTQLELDAHYNSIVSQTVAIEHAGTYTITFNASARRNAETSTFDVSVRYELEDGSEIVETHGVDQLLQTAGLSMQEFNPKTGNHALSFDVDVAEGVRAVTLSFEGNDTTLDDVITLKGDVVDQAIETYFGTSAEAFANPEWVAPEPTGKRVDLKDKHAQVAVFDYGSDDRELKTNGNGDTWYKGGQSFFHGDDGRLTYDTKKLFSGSSLRETELNKFIERLSLNDYKDVEILNIGPDGLTISVEGVKSDSYGALIDDVSMMLTALPDDANAILVSASDGGDDLTAQAVEPAPIPLPELPQLIDDRVSLAETIDLLLAHDVVDFSMTAKGRLSVDLDGDGTEDLGSEINGIGQRYLDKQVQIGSAGGDTLSGNQPGNGWRDMLLGGQGADDLNGRSGQDILFGGHGADLLKGARGHDTINGGEGNDHLIGGRGRDVLTGGAGNDRLDGGRGRDELTGGEGADVFVLAQGYGRKNVVTDFQKGVDKLDLVALGVTDGTGWTAVRQDDDLIVSVEGRVKPALILEDFSDELTSDDFLFG